MSRYRKGSDFERFVKYQLEEEGYFVVRSAGSHGPADLVALKGGFPTMLVQCKAGAITGPDRVSVAMLATEFPDCWVGFATPTGDHPRVKLTRSGA